MEFSVIACDKARGGFLAEHGFSVCVKTERHLLLVDTGASKKTFFNAALFGIFPSQIDTVLLSHGHYDHGGGLPFFLENNKTAQVYVGKGSDGDFYSERNGEDCYIGLDKSIFSDTRVKAVPDFFRIDEELSLFGEYDPSDLLPPANGRLKKRENGGKEYDDFQHERYAVIESNGKRVLLSGCAHRGLPNILRRFKELYGGAPDVLISGFHTENKNGFGIKDREYTEALADFLLDLPTVCYTGHCTGDEAFALLKERLKDRVIAAAAGDRFSV